MNWATPLRGSLAIAALPLAMRKPSLILILSMFFLLTGPIEVQTQKRVRRKQTTNARASIFEDAQRQAMSFWKARVTECGDDYFARLPNGNIIQYRGVSISVASSPLNEADILNGYQFRGTVSFDFRLTREFSAREKRWTPWRGPGSGSAFYRNYITRRSGRWNIEDAGNYTTSGTKQPIACADLNDPAESTRQHFGRKRQQALDAETAGFLRDRNQRGFISNNLTDEMWRSLADIGKIRWMYRASIYSKERYLFTQGQSGHIAYKGLPDEVIKLISEGYDPSSLEFSPNGGWVIFKDQPASIYYGKIRAAAWSNITEKLAKSLQKCGDEHQYVEFLRFTPDGNWIIVIRDFDNPLKPWNYRTTLPENHVLRTFLNGLKDADSVNDIAFFPNGGYLAIYNGHEYASDSIPEDVLRAVADLHNRPSRCPINVSVGFDGTWLVYFSCFRGGP